MTFIAFSQYHYKEILIKMGMLSLRHRRFRGDMIEVFMMIHGIDMVNLGKPFLCTRRKINWFLFVVHDFCIFCAVIVIYFILFFYLFFVIREPTPSTADTNAIERREEGKKRE